MIMDLNFGEPLGLTAIAIILPLMVILAWWNDRRVQQKLGLFAAEKMLLKLTMSFSQPRQRLKSGLSLLACLLLLVAMAKPQWGTTTETIEMRGVDIMIAVDTSRSMLAEDYAPNRLGRSKLAIADLASRLRGDRIGLIAFAGDAFLQCPLTLDYAAFLQILNAMNTDSIPRGGTNIAAAIDEAMAYFEAADSQRVLIIISDGEDLEARGIQKAREAAEHNITVFTIGIGTPEGSLMPLRQADGSVDYVRDHNGNPVLSRLDETTLRLIAEASGGIYQRFTPGVDALEEITHQARALLGEGNAGSFVQEVPIERFYWPLWLAMLCIIVEWSLSNRRRRMTMWKLTAPMAAAILIGILLLGLPFSLQGSPRQAERHYNAGAYEQAIEFWRAAAEVRPLDATLHYNLGNAYYRNQQYADAIAAYQTALPLAEVALQERIFFNLANAQYQLGVEKMPATPEQTTTLWNQSLLNYGNSLAINPEAADARKNRNWVETQYAHHGARIEVLPQPAQGGTTSAGGIFLPGIALELHAEAHENWRFVQWQGAEVEDPEQATTTMIVRESAQVTALFHPTRYLEVHSENDSAGTAGSSGHYDLDAEVPIKARSKDYFAFDRWLSETLTIADPTAAETTLTLSSDGRVIARFVEAYHLQVLAQPEIAGNVGQTGFYACNSQPTIQAQARDGFEWTGWSGDNIIDMEAMQTTVNLIGDSQATAHFKRIWNLVVLPDNDQHGTTTGGGNFPPGGQQPIEAIANDGYTFLGWDGPGVVDPESAQTMVQVLGQEQTVIAIFEASESEDENEQDTGGEDTPENEGESETAPEDGKDEPQESEPEQAQSGEDEQSAEEQPAEPVRETPESLTEEEARQLLQLLRQDERQLPLRINQDPDEASTTGRDW
jgi:Ca-activated chloride channel family protein